MGDTDRERFVTMDVLRIGDLDRCFVLLVSSNIIVLGRFILISAFFVLALVANLYSLFKSCLMTNRCGMSATRIIVFVVLLLYVCMCV